MNDIIRVFPRRTKWTPTDELSFVGEPPLFQVPKLPVHVSVVFTWDRGKAQRLAHAWRAQGHVVRVHGPAFGHKGYAFVPGRFIKNGVTITSRGCPQNCPWCLVPKREGRLREVNIAPGYIVQDNNLLACSRPHIEAVLEMLGQQKRGVVFSGGLDIDYLKPWHIEHFKKLRLGKSGLWVACDTADALKKLDKAGDLLADFSIQKKRCYVLIGFNGESLRDAEARCEAVYAKGFMPFAQLYRDEQNTMRWSAEWRALQRKWSRPAIYNKRKGRE